MFGSFLALMHRGKATGGPFLPRVPRFGGAAGTRICAISTRRFRSGGDPKMPPGRRVLALFRHNAREGKRSRPRL